MNFSGKIRVFCAALLLTLGLTGAASAAGVPKDGVLAFDIVRDGEAIGTHTYRFDRSGDRTEVRIKTDINFRLFSIPVYRFEHESKEVWQDGKLDSLESNTNENGTGETPSPSGRRFPWSMAKTAISMSTAKSFPQAFGIVRSRPQPDLTTISGNVKKFEVEYVGEAELDVRGKNTTQHFRLTGEFERELWYDKDDVLVGVRFEASDGSTVAYVLK